MAVTHKRNTDNFANWLIQQMDRDDVIGGVAWAVETDECLPGPNYHDIALHAERDHKARPYILEALKQAYEEWRSDTPAGRERERHRIEAWSMARYGLTGAELDSAARKYGADKVRSEGGYR